MRERLSISLPTELHTILKAEAKRRGLSIAGVVRELLLRHYAVELEDEAQPANNGHSVPRRRQINQPQK